MTAPAPAPGNVPSVAVIDDHDAIHAAVRFWCLDTSPAIHYAGGYFTSEQFFRSRSTPSVVIFDLEPATRKPDFENLLQVVATGARVVVYSYRATDEIVLRCLELGAVTYLVKDEGRNHLIDAIRAAHSDVPYLGPMMARVMLNDRSVGRPNLAPREKEVLVAWFQTESKELVAEKLFIAANTVRTHLQRVRAKYAAVGRPAPTKSALVARAIQDGIIGPDDL